MIFIEVLFITVIQRDPAPVKQLFAVQDSFEAGISRIKIYAHFLIFHFKGHMHKPGVIDKTAA
ncbi:MAG: hypothetical protein IKD92_08185, partial [Lachnospiraceae bacterium]|nr:hypothetical protein [Lachnospiraceae bacterium]